ncbi:hypothetical protein ACIBI7_17865 [Nonomuraea fuscirosea]|uniref:hypothetical protein n=1 Tax=Nonomuraea fuscirosea TaxID=1291556 RepID=UPI0037B3B0A4
MDLVFDLPEEIARVAEYSREKKLAEAHAQRPAELAVRAAKSAYEPWVEPDTARVMGLSKQCAVSWS